MKNKLFLFVILFAVVAFEGCREKTGRPLRIAVSKITDSYRDWLLKADSTLDLVNLYGMTVDSAVECVSSCDGLLITGGDDVYPGYYDKLCDTVLCEGFDLYRDSLEMTVIATAKKMGMPLFGVCRGLQIINVEAGGSLVPDLPARKPSEVAHRCSDWKNCFHEINVDTLSQLYLFTGCRDGMVNTNHHQAIDRLGGQLKITAWSSDSVPEAIEPDSSASAGFLMAVQWHPERLSQNPAFSFPLARRFVEAAILFHNRPVLTIR